MTIKERIETIMSEEIGNLDHPSFDLKYEIEAALERIATEQKEIDINTAMWAFWEIVSPYFPDKDIAEEVSDRFLKIMMRQL